MEPVFSTILTSYNRSALLEDAVASVFNQTFKNWELIIADYSCDKEERKKISDFGKRLIAGDERFSFIQYPAVEKENNTEQCNYAIHINKCLKRAKGKYITYLCDDDLYLPEYYQVMLDTFTKYPQAKIVYTGLSVCKLGEDKCVLSRPAEHIKRCMFYSVDHICVAHEREIIDEVGGWDEAKWVRTYGDAEVWYKFAMAGHLAYPTGKYTAVKRICKDSYNATGA